MADITKSGKNESLSYLDANNWRDYFVGCVRATDDRKECREEANELFKRQVVEFHSSDQTENSVTKERKTEFGGTLLARAGWAFGGGGAEDAEGTEDNKVQKNGLLYLLVTSLNLSVPFGDLFSIVFNLEGSAARGLSVFPESRSDIFPQKGAGGGGEIGTATGELNFEKTEKAGEGDEKIVRASIVGGKIDPDWKSSVGIGNLISGQKYDPVYVFLGGIFGVGAVLDWNISDAVNWTSRLFYGQEGALNTITFETPSAPAEDAVNFVTNLTVKPSKKISLIAQVNVASAVQKNGAGDKKRKTAISETAAIDINLREASDIKKPDTLDGKGFQMGAQIRAAQLPDGGDGIAASASGAYYFKVANKQTFVEARAAWSRGYQPFATVDGTPGIGSVSGENQLDILAIGAAAGMDVYSTTEDNKIIKTVNLTVSAENANVGSNDEGSMNIPAVIGTVTITY